MALEIAHQYKYSGRGPLDSKSLVKTFADLVNEETWLTENEKLSAYNGMLVAVWLDGENNGIYYLHDQTVTSTFKAPDVTNVSNWHKIGEVTDVAALEERVAALEAGTPVVGAPQNIQTFAEYSQLPTVGKAGVLYAVIDKNASYVYQEGSYICVGNTAEAVYKDIQVICGGNANK